MPITLNDTVRITAPKSIDSRSGVFAGGAFRAYTSVVEANANILGVYRNVGLTVLINVGGTNVEYWYKDGITNSDLILKTVSGASSGAGEGNLFS